MSMVDVSDKPNNLREATATGTIKLKTNTIRLIAERRIAKGDPVHTAKIAAVLAAKKTSEIIPLCHQLPLAQVEVDVSIDQQTKMRVTTKVKTIAKTGVEMEALTATAVGLLTIWDMVKQYEKDAEGQYPSTSIEKIHVEKKVKKPVERRRSQK